jgi:hypothetical protein
MTAKKPRKDLMVRSSTGPERTGEPLVDLADQHQAFVARPLRKSRL